MNRSQSCRGLRCYIKRMRASLSLSLKDGNHVYVTKDFLMTFKNLQTFSLYCIFTLCLKPYYTTDNVVVVRMSPHWSKRVWGHWMETTRSWTWTTKDHDWMIHKSCSRVQQFRIAWVQTSHQTCNKIPFISKKLCGFLLHMQFRWMLTQTKTWRKYGYCGNP